MKTIKYIINRLAIITLLMSSTVFLGCSKDDEVEEPPIDQTISFKVDLIKLTGIATSGDGNSELEVYGNISTRLNVGSLYNEETLWNKEQQDYVSITEADFPISTSKTFNVLESQLSEVSIDLTANLMEYDSNVNNEDDPIGNETLTTLLSGLSSTTTYEILLDDTENQEVQVTYSITRL
ncbi:hypothetical protein [Winogradskyella sp.]|uniref:hypothetical protein n=1 Tax=Winogradskyella sp. TaxID=1883156 RepID=UPI002621A16D|nr:hypothetical protein [Winogradskyella sp.]